MTTGNQRALARDQKRYQSAMKAALTLSPSLASKIASVVVHADELLSSKGHIVDKAALETARNDPEVVAWIKALGVLAPLKRSTEAERLVGERVGLLRKQAE